MLGSTRKRKSMMTIRRNKEILKIETEIRNHTPWEIPPVCLQNIGLQKIQTKLILQYLMDSRPLSG